MLSFTENIQLNAKPQCNSITQCLRVETAFKTGSLDNALK